MIGDIIIANVIASSCLVLLIYFFDLNEKEPPWTLIRIYILTILITFLFGKLKGFLFTHYEWQFPVLIENYIMAGFFEELLKFIIVLIFVWHLKSFNEETDGIIYYLIVAAGFAVLENVGYSFKFVITPYLYGLKSGDMNFYQQALQRIVLFRAVSGHILINIISGFFLGIAKRRQKKWLLVPGFLLSVLLHGTWNQAAFSGFFTVYALSLIVVDVVIFFVVIRMSFYFKFMKRLRLRINSLIKEGEIKNFDRDIITLIRGIKQNLRTLRQMEGDILVANSKEIVTLLPSHIDSVPMHGKDGLTERMLKINGLLGREKQKFGIWFYSKLFLKFSIAGFLILTLLMNIT